MWTLRMVVSAALICAGLVASANAQRSRQFRFDPLMPGVWMMLIETDAVRAELDLDETQTLAIDRLTADNRGFLRSVASLSQQERAAEFEARSDRLEPQVREVLTDEQSQRLDQIVLQQRGPAALVDERFAERLTLSDEQRRKIELVVELFRQDQSRMIDQLRSGTGRRQAVQQMRARWNRQNEDILALLDDQQRGTWEESLGEPFDRPRQLPRPGRRPRRDEP